MRLADWLKRDAQPMRIPRDPRLRPVRDFGALRLGVTCLLSREWTRREMARGAVWRAHPTGALPPRSPQGLGTLGGPQ